MHQQQAKENGSVYRLDANHIRPPVGSQSLSSATPPVSPETPVSQAHSTSKATLTSKHPEENATTPNTETMSPRITTGQEGDPEREEGSGFRIGDVTDDLVPRHEAGDANVYAVDQFILASASLWPTSKPPLTSSSIPPDTKETSSTLTIRVTARASDPNASSLNSTDYPTATFQTSTPAHEELGETPFNQTLSKATRSTITTGYTPESTSIAQFEDVRDESLLMAAPHPQTTDVRDALPTQKAISESPPEERITTTPPNQSTLGWQDASVTHRQSEREQPLRQKGLSYRKQVSTVNLSDEFHQVALFQNSTSNTSELLQPVHVKTLTTALNAQSSARLLPEVQSTREGNDSSAYPSPYFQQSSSTNRTLSSSTGVTETNEKLISSSNLEQKSTPTKFVQGIVRTGVHSSQSITNAETDIETSTLSGTKSEAFTTTFSPQNNTDSTTSTSYIIIPQEFTRTSAETPDMPSSTMQMSSEKLASTDITTITRRVEINNIERIKTTSSPRLVTDPSHPSTLEIRIELSTSIGSDEHKSLQSNSIPNAVVSGLMSTVSENGSMNYNSIDWPMLNESELDSNQSNDLQSTRTNESNTLMSEIWTTKQRQKSSSLSVPRGSLSQTMGLTSAKPSVQLSFGRKTISDYTSPDNSYPTPFTFIEISSSSRTDSSTNTFTTTSGQPVATAHSSHSNEQWEFNNSSPRPPLHSPNALSSEQRAVNNSNGTETNMFSTQKMSSVEQPKSANSEVSAAIITTPPTKTKFIIMSTESDTTAQTRQELGTSTHAEDIQSQTENTNWLFAHSRLSVISTYPTKLTSLPLAEDASSARRGIHHTLSNIISTSSFEPTKKSLTEAIMLLTADRPFARERVEFATPEVSTTKSSATFSSTSMSNSIAQMTRTTDSTTKNTTGVSTSTRSPTRLDRVDGVMTPESQIPFNIEYIPAGCNGVNRRLVGIGELETPFVPPNYPETVHCLWTIYTPIRRPSSGNLISMHI